ncbi:hypothetical protein CDL15_Pgr016776 [Punica granatum]|uniref:Uncharacterized protein n=1 Tax=Punica granatum TaxID=22663 RepID=A0A218WXX8_PUNGR|nr:hypothetical protein CDL15_Pgr016776 [Punica granatum]
MAGDKAQKSFGATLSSTNAASTSSYKGRCRRIFEVNQILRHYIKVITDGRISNAENSRFPHPQEKPNLTTNKEMVRYGAYQHWLVAKKEARESSSQLNKALECKEHYKKKYNEAKAKGKDREREVLKVKESLDTRQNQIIQLKENLDVKRKDKEQI